MVNRDKILQQVSAYLDGELTQEARQEFEASIAQDPVATKVLQQVRSLKEDLANLAPISSSPDFEQKLQQRLQNDSGRSWKIGLSPDGRAPDWKLPALGLAACIVALSFFMVSPDPSGVNVAAPQESGFTPSLPVQDSEGIATPDPDRQLTDAQKDSVRDETNKKLRKNMQMVNDKSGGK